MLNRRPPIEGNEQARERQPGGVRAPTERDHEPGEPLGAGRETPPRRLLQAPDPGGEERLQRSCVRLAINDTEASADSPSTLIALQSECAR